MNRDALTYALLLIMAQVCLLGSVVSPCFGLEPTKVAVVVSQRIKPYVEVLAGINRALAQESTIRIESLFLSPGDDSYRKVQERVTGGAYQIAVAIGPEAGRLVWDLGEARLPKKIYAAILNPDASMDQGVSGCGISLNIPVETQVSEIAANFPELLRIGLLFDSRNNDDLYRLAVAAAAAAGIRIVPLDVTAKKEIPNVLRRNWGAVDCIWMVPDGTVISEKIVQYVIKKALYENKGVLGYNPFFIRSGAIFALTFEYEKIGEQAAGRVMAFLKQGVCQSMPPLFNSQINRKMARKLGIRVGGAP